MKQVLEIEVTDGKKAIWKDVVYDQQTEEQQKEGCLKPVFVNDELIMDYTLTEIRNNIDSTL